MGRKSIGLGVVAAACTAAAAVGVPAQAAPRAVAAGTLSFNVTSNLKLVGKPGRVLNEKGTFSGSQSGTIEVRFTMITKTSGEASFTAYSSKGGSVSGHTAARGHEVGAIVNFTGTMTITGGTGRWSHASGHDLKFTGSVDRRDFHATTQMQGTFDV